MKGNSSIGEGDGSGVDQVTQIFATRKVIVLDYICARTMDIS